MTERREAATAVARPLPLLGGLLCMTFPFAVKFFGRW